MNKNGISASNGPKKLPICNQCGYRWRRSWAKGLPRECPVCGSRRWNQAPAPALDPDVVAELERCIAKALRVRPDRKRAEKGKAASAAAIRRKRTRSKAR